MLRHFGGYGTRLVRARKAQLCTSVTLYTGFLDFGLALFISWLWVVVLVLHPLEAFQVGGCLSSSAGASGHWIYEEVCTVSSTLTISPTVDATGLLAVRIGQLERSSYPLRKAGSRSSRRLSRPPISLRPRENDADGSLGSLSVARVGSWSTG